MQWNQALSTIGKLSLGACLLHTGTLGTSRAQSAPQAGDRVTQPDAGKKPAARPSSATEPAKSGAGNQTRLQAVATVNASITVEAGLLPYDSAKQLFGGWVADHFAVVQVAIGNHSREQQFILQDIYFDYSRWALSGIYHSDDADSRQKLQDYQQGTLPGEISSIGALEIHDELKSASVFSPRNTWVNGLILVGTAAGGFAFLGPVGFTQGATGYNSALIPGLQKFWPDRTIDQQTNVLKYGFQDKMVIGKEDPAKTYAFFPIDRFLTRGLGNLYRKDPAIFFNPAELFLDPTVPSMSTDAQASQGACSRSMGHRSDCKVLLPLKRRLMDLIASGLPKGETLTDAQVLRYLTSPCDPWASTPASQPDDDAGDPKTKQNSDQGEGEKAGEKALPANCRFGLSDAEARKEMERVRAIKGLMEAASLVNARIVVNGIMTVDVETVPAIISGVSFDKQNEGESFWQDTKTKHTGVISGRFLFNGKPAISGIQLPLVSIGAAIPEKTAKTAETAKTESSPKPAAAQTKKNAPQAKTGATAKTSDSTTKDAASTGSNESDAKDASAENHSKAAASEQKPAQVSDYIDANSLVALQEGSTDSELHFSVEFKKPIPTGTTLKFQVLKSSSRSVNNDNTGANTTETTSSMTYDYAVDYKSSTPATTPTTETPVQPAKAVAKTPGSTEKPETSTSESTPSALTDKDPLVLRVKGAEARAGDRSAGFLVIGDRLDAVTGVLPEDTNAIRIRGFLPSSDGNYLDVGIAVAQTTKPGSYSIQILGEDEKVVKVIPFKVDK